MLDRTKEPGALAEPLYLDVMTALVEAYSRSERDAAAPIPAGGAVLRSGQRWLGFGDQNSIKIIGNGTPLFAQCYFVYDSKKAGGLTVSHLRVSEKPINSAYLVGQADFVGCHQSQFIDKYQMVERLRPGGIFLVNTPYGADEIWARLPQEVQALLNERQARFYVINAQQIARECLLGARINTAMQMAFFQLSGILPPDTALSALQQAGGQKLQQ